MGASSDLAGEASQSPCTPNRRRAAGRSLAGPPLVPARCEPSQSLGGGWVQDSLFPRYPAFWGPRIPGRREGVREPERGTSLGKRICAQRGRRQTGTAARPPCSALARWRPKARGPRARAKLGLRGRRAKPTGPCLLALPRTSDLAPRLHAHANARHSGRPRLRGSNRLSLRVAPSAAVAPEPSGATGTRSRDAQGDVARHPRLREPQPRCIPGA